MKPIAYYITAHGYGHGTRSGDVLRALHRLCPEQPVIVITDLSRDFLNSRLAGCDNLTLRMDLGWSHDTRDSVIYTQKGVIQKLNDFSF